MSESNQIKQESNSLSSLDVSLGRIANQTVTLEQYKAGKTVVGEPVVTEVTQNQIKQAEQVGNSYHGNDVHDPRDLTNRSADYYGRKKTF